MVKLSRTRRIGISSFKGNTMVNIREYYEKDGAMLPGKKVWSSCGTSSSEGLCGPTCGFKSVLCECRHKTWRNEADIIIVLGYLLDS